MIDLIIYIVLGGGILGTVIYHILTSKKKNS